LAGEARFDVRQPDIFPSSKSQEAAHASGAHLGAKVIFCWWVMAGMAAI